MPSTGLPLRARLPRKLAKAALRRVSSFALPPRPVPTTHRPLPKAHRLRRRSPASRSISVRPRPPLDCSLSSSRPNTSSRPTADRQATWVAAPTRLGASGVSPASRLRKALPPRWRATRSPTCASRP